MARSDMDLPKLSYNDGQNTQLGLIPTLRSDVDIGEASASDLPWTLSDEYFRVEFLGGEMKGFHTQFDTTAAAAAEPTAERSLTQSILDDWLRAPPF